MTQWDPTPGEVRESREFWYADDESGIVRKVTGWSCGPGAPDVWWCPEAGYSMSVGHSLFLSRRLAIRRLIEKLKAAKDEANALYIKAVEAYG